jgi:uncharacterized alpha/beta hydrolase family protein
MKEIFILIVGILTFIPIIILFWIITITELKDYFKNNKKTHLKK